MDPRGEQLSSSDLTIDEDDSQWSTVESVTTGSSSSTSSLSLDSSCTDSSYSETDTETESEGTDIGDLDLDHDLKLPPVELLSLELKTELKDIEKDKTEIRETLYADLYKEDDMDDVPQPTNRPLLVIHFGTYVNSYKHTLPAEFCIARFTVEDGITDCVSGMIDPVNIPLGYRSDVMSQRARCGYELPGFYLKKEDKEYDPFRSCGLFIYQFLRRNMQLGSEAYKRPILYTMEEHAVAVEACIDWLNQHFHNKGLRATIKYRLKFLPALVEVLYTEIDRLKSMGGIRRESKETVIMYKHQAIAILTKDYEFLNDPYIVCPHHEKDEVRDKWCYCSTHLVKSWIYTILKYVCSRAECPRVAGRHYPEPQATKKVASDDSKKLDKNKNEEQVFGAKLKMDAEYRVTLPCFEKGRGRGLGIHHDKLKAEEAKRRQAAEAAKAAAAADNAETVEDIENFADADEAQNVQKVGNPEVVGVAEGARAKTLP